MSWRAERDFIRVAGRERHRQIMVCIYRQPVRMFDLGMRYRHGGYQDVAVRNAIGAGQCTCAIGLRDQRRDIAGIMMAYRTLGRGHGALVRVYAR